jgi:hypothetical protein
MESRAFIKHTEAMIEKIKNTAVIGLVDQEVARQGKEENQKELNLLFSGMNNPTLPSAYKLAKIAQEYGYTISPVARNKLDQVEKENWWSV